MSALLSVRIDDAINSQLNAIANQQHKTRTEIVQTALISYLKTKNSKLSKQMEILRASDNNDDYLSEDL